MRVSRGCTLTFTAGRKEYVLQYFLVHARLPLNLAQRGLNPPTTSLHDVSMPCSDSLPHRHIDRSSYSIYRMKSPAKAMPPTSAKVKKRKQRQQPAGKAVAALADSGLEDRNCVLPPCRDCAELYTAAETYRCALSSGNPCVPCAYKIGTYDVSLDREFTRAVPNARPESCRRFDLSGAAVAKDGTLGYRRGMRVLTVGDGDLSFSLAVARIVLGSDACGSVRSGGGGFVATSYESRECLIRVYPGVQDILEELDRLGATICFEVDGTNLAGTLPQDVLRGQNCRPKFDRIAWNFPCSAISSGRDGQNDAMEYNKSLIRRFVRSASHDLLSRDGGELHMAHKTKPPFSQWSIETVALEGARSAIQVEGKRTNSIEYKGRITFDRCTIPPYIPRKALDRKSFTSHDACTYVFGWTNEDSNQFPSSIPSEQECNNEERLLPVTGNMIRQIRGVHLVNAKRRNANKRQRSEGTKPRRGKCKVSVK